MKKWGLFFALSMMSFLLQATPLKASEVFQLSSKKIDPNTFMLQWIIKPGYFLYADRIHLKEQTDNTLDLGNVRFPAALKKVEKLGHEYPVYREQLDLPVAVLGKTPGESIIEVQYQGCADDGFCYPPVVERIKLAFDKNLALDSASIEPIEKPKATAPPPKDKIEVIFENYSWFMVILSFFGFGLLLSLTPCILPMIPVLSGIIVGHGQNLTQRKAFFLSLSYVLSMSLTYALVGAIVARLGSNLQVVMQDPVAISIFSLIFVLLALSMFGFYDMRLPTSWQAKIASASRSRSSGHYASAAIMGCLSTLILSPCVTAPLIGALGYIAKTGDIILGSMSLFALGLGMGVPLLLVGISAGRWLPKAGHWMSAVKAFFGILLLAVAIYLIDRILPGPLVMVLWASLFIFSGIYCGAFIRGLTNQGKFCQGLGLILFFYGMLILIGASMGSSNPLQPLAGFRIVTTNISSNQETVKTLEHLNEAIANARGKPVLLDFYADWCSSCKIMEATTLQDPKIKEALANFVVVKVDVTGNKAQEKALLQQYNVIAPPTFLFLNEAGMEQTQLRLVGEPSTFEFLEKINQALRPVDN